MVEYFADTYALIEIAKGNPNYQAYESADIVLTEWNLAEFYYALIREERPARQQFDEFGKFVIKITMTSIIRAAHFKLQHKKERLSYPDCIGYMLALEQGMKFLTGDEKFKSLPNVEWVR